MSGAVVTASELRVQVTVVVPVHVQPLPEAETKLVPAGNGSETDSELASDGPRFATVNTYVIVLPQYTLAGPLFVIDRLALVFTTVASVALLLPGVASGVELETLAVFDRSVVRLELTFTTNVNAFAAWLSEKVPRLQLTEIGRATCRERAEAETEVVPADNGSETATVNAADGSALSTVIV